MPAIRRSAIRPLRVLVLALLMCLCSTGLCEAWIVVDDNSTRTPPQRDPGTLPMVSSSAERQLLQIGGLLEAEAYDEALSALEKLLESREEGYLKLEDETFATLSQVIHRKIATSPAELLTAYRGRVDSIAESLWQESLQTYSSKPLQRIVAEFYCSSFGDDALMRLGEFALERGDIDAARSYWLQISPRLTDPDGRGWGSVATAEQISKNAEQLKQLTSKPKSSLSQLWYPSGDVEEHRVLARLATASIRSGEFDRARAEIGLLKVLAPNASARIGGRDQPLEPSLTAMLESAEQWPSQPPPRSWGHPLGQLAGTSQAKPVGPMRGVAWTTIDSVKPKDESATEFQQKRLRAAKAYNESYGPIAVPLVVGDRVLIHRDGLLQAIDLPKGSPTITESGEVYREASSSIAKMLRERVPPQVAAPRAFNRPMVQGRIIINGRIVQQIGGPAMPFGGPQLGVDNRFMPRRAPNGLPTPGAMLASMSVDDNMLYATLGMRAAAGDDSATRFASGNKRLLGLDLDREGYLAWEPQRLEKGEQFSGPPVPVDDVVLVPVRNATSGAVRVLAYDKTSAELRWQSMICFASLDSPYMSRTTGDWIRVDDSTVYFDTEEGFLVALDLASGQTKWTFQYSFATRKSTQRNPQQLLPPVSGGCLVRNGLVIVAPENAAAIYAIDAATGKLIWQNKEAWDVNTLIGVRDGRLFASGKRLWNIDLQTGKSKWTWPESTTAGIVGSGRGCIAGDELFWPTSDYLYCFDLSTGAQSRKAYPIEELGAGRGTLVVPAQSHLLISTIHGIAALGPVANPVPTETTPAIQ